MNKQDIKHTKGNWFAKEGQIYPEETGKTLALIPYFDKDNKEHQANQKLIAAAPELLKCAEMLLNLSENIRTGTSQTNYFKELEDNLTNNEALIKYAAIAINKATQ